VNLLFDGEKPAGKMVGKVPNPARLRQIIHPLSWKGDFACQSRGYPCEPGLFFVG
jgi:hypothetical protein